MVCIEDSLGAAKSFASKQQIGGKVVHLQGRSSSLSAYALKYIPHTCVVDGNGIIVMNYDGGMSKAIAVLEKAAAEAKNSST